MPITETSSGLRPPARPPPPRPVAPVQLCADPAERRAGHRQREHQQHARGEHRLPGRHDDGGEQQDVQRGRGRVARQLRLHPPHAVLGEGARVGEGDVGVVDQHVAGENEHDHADQRPHAAGSHTARDTASKVRQPRRSAARAPIASLPFRGDSGDSPSDRPPLGRGERPRRPRRPRVHRRRGRPVELRCRTARDAWGCAASRRVRAVGGLRRRQARGRSLRQPRDDFRCAIHAVLRDRGFAGARCSTASARASVSRPLRRTRLAHARVAAPMFAAFGNARQVHELLWYPTRPASARPIRRWTRNGPARRRRSRRARCRGRPRAGRRAAPRSERAPPRHPTG